MPLQQQLQRLLLLLQQEWPAAVATGLFAYLARTLLQGLPFMMGCMRDYPSPFAFYSRNLLRLLRRRRSSSSSSSSSSSRKKGVAPALLQQQQPSAIRLLGERHVSYRQSAAAAAAAEDDAAAAASCRSSSSSCCCSKQKLRGRQRTRPPMTLAVDLDETLILATRIKVL